MAKHIVKCAICGKQFDANAEPYIKVNSRRYAHESCALSADEKKTKEQKDKEALEAYILQLFKIEYITPKIRKQIESYIKENNYTYSGIHKALVYFFEIKGNTTDKANGGIGIVPYTYEAAYRYYYALWEAQQKNENKVQKIQEYVPKVIEIRIQNPERKVKKRRNLFSFLDEEGEE